MLKKIYVTSALLLQKPSRKSKARDHLVALERRLKLWEEIKIQKKVFRPLIPNEFAKNLYEIQAFNAERECQQSTSVIDKQHE